MLLAIIRDAGWPIWPLLLTSVLAVTFIIERSVSLRRGKVIPLKLVSDVLTLLQSNKIDDNACAKLNEHSQLGKILAAGLKEIINNKDNNAHKRQIANAMQIAGKQVAHELEHYLNALGTIASAAPLMGLFGTVIGMIEIFSSQTQNGTTPAILAHGISIALYNTAFGLLIAIPALIFWRGFRRHVDQLLFELEQQASIFLEKAIIIE